MDRSYLFVPGDRPERFAKALSSGAHAVIVDLEDAVQPRQKHRARELLDGWLATADQSVYVRVNPAGTEWHERDLALLRHRTLRGVMLPKAGNPDVLNRVAAAMDGRQELLPLIETVEGLFAAAQIAAVRRVRRLAFGSLDFMSDSGIQSDGAELDPVRTQLVLESRRAGLPAPIDGVTTALQDLKQVAHEARRSRRFGFGAKLCIHPAQVSTVNEAFGPSSAEADWARRVMDAVRSDPHGAISVDGKLVDRPVELLARRILEESTDLPRNGE